MSTITNKNIRGLVKQYRNPNTRQSVIDLYGNISNWDVSNVTDMAGLFYNLNSFNEPLTSWNVSNVTDMTQMFSRATSFNQPLNSWNTSKVIKMRSLFSNAESFNQPLNSWDTSNVINMNGMFSAAYNFNQSLDSWNTSNVTDMGWLFSNTLSFNQPINSWNTSNVTDMCSMFSSAKRFNQPLDSWDTSNVINMSGMFDTATSFNQPLNSWNTSNVTDMAAMFIRATSFNQPLDSWDTSNVIQMYSMFKGATSFNQPLDSWNTDRVISMTNIFEGATSFNQPLDNFFKPLYKKFPNKEDPRYIEFDQKMDLATNNKKTTIQRDNKLFIDDKLLDNTEQKDKYRIEYEEFEGKSYPIIHILKGTILFTARAIQSPNDYDSFYYLYKLNTADTLNTYGKDNYKDVLTYFFPIPYMCQVVSQKFTNMNAVILTKDIKLLCLISPSPLIRGDKGSSLGNSLQMNKCKSRQYDLCVSSKLINGLKLNGYIGIADEDSLKKYFRQLEDLFKTISVYSLKSTLLYKSSSFNNFMHDKNLQAYSTTMFTDFATQLERTFGTPELTLIPYDIHSVDADNKYREVRDSFTSKLNSSSTIDASDYEPFIFKPFISVNTGGIATTNPGFILANQILQILDQNTDIKKSLQAYPLFNIHYPDADPSIRDKYAIDYMVDGNVNVPQQNMFMTTYSSTRDPEKDLSAFELIYTYTTPVSNMTGGEIGNMYNEKNPLIINDNIYNAKNQLMTNDNIYNAKNQSTTELKKVDYRTLPITHNDDFLYYETKNGIPVLYFNTEKMNEKQGGKTKKRKIIKQKNKTKRYKNKRKNKNKTRKNNRKKTRRY